MQVSFNLRVGFTIARQTYSEELRFKSVEDREKFVDGLDLFDVNFNVKKLAEWEDYVSLSSAEARVELRRTLVNKVAK